MQPNPSQNRYMPIAQQQLVGMRRFQGTASPAFQNQALISQQQNLAGARFALQRKGAVQTLVATEGESQTDAKTVATWVGAFTLGVLASYHPYAEKFKFAPKVNVGVNL